MLENCLKPSISWDFRGGPVVKTPDSFRGGPVVKTPDSFPGGGTKIPHARWHGKKINQ